jgi:outer membrane protein OmpA-like peptidoglycan-associated protein
MRILIIGLVVFIIWSLFSVWLYTKMIRPAMSGPDIIHPVQEMTGNIADSTSIADTLVRADSTLRQEALMPNDLITYFDFDDARFVSDGITDKHAGEFHSWLKENPGSILLITGHTDSKGSSEYNWTLGLERARSMQKYFIEFGIDANKLETVSKGENEPVADQATEKGRAKNRRAVITLKN